MPIKGLTTDVRPQFPSLGKLRKGAKKVSDRKPGEDLSYFRFTSDDPQIEAAFYAAYPAHPRSVNIFLPNRTVDDNWEAWQEDWVAGGLKHRCDGETCVVWQDDAGEYHTDPKPCPGECKPVGRLQVMLPELLQAGYVGYVTVETHSKHDIMSTQACLEDAAGKANGNGLQGIEFRLYRAEQVISTPMIDKQTGEVKRVRRAKWLVKLTPTVRWVQAQLAQAERLQLGEPEALALPEPEVEEAEFIEIDEPDWDDDEEEPESEPAWYDGKIQTIDRWLDRKYGITVKNLNDHEIELSQFRTREDFVEYMETAAPAIAKQVQIETAPVETLL